VVGEEVAVVIGIIVVMAWIAILAPNVVRRRAAGGDGIHSISHFHHHLSILEHSSPTPVVTPAFRLRAVDGTGVSAGDGSSEAPKLTVVRLDPLPRPALAFLGEDPVATSGQPAIPAADARATTQPVSGLAASRVSARQLTLRRRRDTLGVLVLLVTTTAAAGLVPGARVAWSLTIVAGLVLTGYIALLVHLRRTAEERGRKLHYLAPRQAQRHTGMASSAAMARFAHPSNQSAAAL
jgi:hypothetical protein